MKHTFRKQHFSSLCNGSLLLVLGATLLFGACADDDLANEQPGKHTGTTVAFNVSDAQMEALAQAGAKGMTRGLSPQPLSSADLAPRKLEATGSNPHDFCLIESTVEGINPVKPAEGTRAEIIKTATLGNFSSIGYRASQPYMSNSLATGLLWFYNEKTDKDGNIVNHRYDWDWPVNVYAHFYAVYPEATAANGITLTGRNYPGIPHLDFVANQDVKQQVDLMTACSGEVHYIHGNDPTSNLKFNHALAAIKFSIGSNLSPVIIKKIELKNVKYKGQFDLHVNTPGEWNFVSNELTTVTLDGINLNAAEMPNTMLAGALDPDPDNHNRAGRENYTFLLPPQELSQSHPANPVLAVIHYKEAGVDKTISFKLTGQWRIGTTKEYKLSQKNSSWEYHFTLEDNNLNFNYDETAAKTFKVSSWRDGIDPVTHAAIKQPVTWKVVKYEESVDNGQTWVDRGLDMPRWISGMTTGASSNIITQGTILLANGMINGIDGYNQLLKKGPFRGTKDDYYDLSTHDVKGTPTQRNTANCYIISHPGYYEIPLVYGNAIKNGMDNTNSYTSMETGTWVLQHFKDHNDQDITDPWIEQTNGRANNGINGTKLIWADEPNLVQWIGTGIVRRGAEAYLQFEVKKENIKNGNAVIAVMKNGTVVWSWHLWFVNEDALNTIPCWNYQNIRYDFTQEALGMKYTAWNGTSYSVPHRVKIKVIQTTSNHGVNHEGVITITQNPSAVTRQGFTTFYQWGRKDAFPGTDTFYPSNGYSFVFDNIIRQGRSLGYVIQHPEKAYAYEGSGDWCNATYANTWSANNPLLYNFSNDPIIKTVYDPCPAGFHIPPSQAFTGFSKNLGVTANAPADGWNGAGWNFYTRPNGTSTTPTIYFPASGRRGLNGSLYRVATDGYYWSALSNNSHDTFCLIFTNSVVSVNSLDHRAFSHSVRPVADN